jgi:hypothetical protein
LVLTLAALAVPTDASASCGDYVTIDGRAGAHEPMPAAVESDPAGPRRCSGPSCSRNQDDIPAPSVPAAAPSVPRPAAVPADLHRLPPADRAGLQAGNEAAGSPVHHPTPIFHPPRHA